MAKKNILLIMCDTVRTDVLGRCTKNLDKLAKNGAIFTDCNSVSPVCSPARCSLMRGVYPNVHNVIENGITPIENMTTLPDLLKESGYYNIFVGKSHFGEMPKSFDVAFNLQGEKNAENDDFYGEFAKENGYIRASRPPFDKPKEFCIDYYTATKTIEEIDKAKDKTFFAFCSMLSPHGPIDTPKEFRDVKVDLPVQNYQENEEKNLPKRLKNLLDLDGKANDLYKKEGYTLEDNRESYYQLMNYCDEQIGRIIDYLKDNDLIENTVVIFTSDHGTQNFDHGFRDKHNFFKESMNVPLIIHCPSLIPKNTVRKMANTLDVSKTILGIAGINCDYFGGFDLISPIVNNEENSRTATLSMLFGYTALVTEKYKLEYYFDSDEIRFFNRLEDENEQNNLGENEISLKLLRVLLAWQNSIVNLEYLKNNSKGTGPVAKRVKKLLDNMTAQENEKLFQERANCI